MSKRIILVLVLCCLYLYPACRGSMAIEDSDRARLDRMSDEIARLNDRLDRAEGALERIEHELRSTRAAAERIAAALESLEALASPANDTDR